MDEDDRNERTKTREYGKEMEEKVEERWEDRERKMKEEEDKGRRGGKIGKGGWKRSRSRG